MVPFVSTQSYKSGSCILKSKLKSWLVRWRRWKVICQVHSQSFVCTLHAIWLRTECPQLLKEWSSFAEWRSVSNYSNNPRSKHFHSLRSPIPFMGPYLFAVWLEVSILTVIQLLYDLLASVHCLWLPCPQMDPKSKFTFLPFPVIPLIFLERNSPGHCPSM